jgi:hypothetical protein
MTTKKIFYSSVLALLLCACINETIQSPVSDSGNAVGFGTVLAPSTRGAVFDKDSLAKTTNGFSVSAYYTGATAWASYAVPDVPDFMNNTEVTNGGSGWIYSPIRYWPGRLDNTNYGKVTFFALSGEGLASSDNTIAYNSSSKKPEFSYTTAAAAADQKDLIADVQFDQAYDTNTGVPGQVKFQFKHILSKIGFTAKLGKYYSDATLKVKVTHLQVNYTASKIKSSGTYNFGVSGTDPWTLGSSSFVSGDNSGELLKSSEVELSKGTSDAAPIAEQLNDNSKFLMLIPQTTPTADVSADEGSGDLTVELTYTVTTGTGADEKTFTYPVTYKLPKCTYAPGKQYTYNFTITLNEVVFTVLEVTGWTDGTQPGNIDL